jgi:hypothetical protein
MSEPSERDQTLREQIKTAIITAQDSAGRLLQVIPQGVAGMYADAVMRVLTMRPYPYASEHCDARWHTYVPVGRSHQCDLSASHAGVHECICGETLEPTDPSPDHTDPAS